jgi:DNA-binding transcriptional ArsR family regulator
VIEMRLTPVDLAQIRFAYSPLRELVASLRVLRDPQPRHMYRRWLSAVSGRLAGLNRPLLAALAPAGAHMYTFLTPRLNGPSPTLEDELATLAVVDADLVRDDLKVTAHGRPIPEVLLPLYEDPVAELPRVLDELARYWRAAMDPFWPQTRAIARADVSYRMEQFAAAGVATVLDNLHHKITFNADRLLIHQPRHCTQRYHQTGQGIVLVPCVFSWPTLFVDCCDPVQPSLSYPPRGIAHIGTDGTDPRNDRHDQLSDLIGRTRTSLLMALEYPKSTTQLAKELDYTLSSVSQHLKILKAVEMVTSSRQGRLVLYQRTPSATALLTSARTDRYPG